MPIDWKSIIRTVAPTLATALGSPLAGMATKVVSEALLGKPDGTETEIAAKITAGGPELLEKMREADQKFATQMKQFDINLEKIAADDRGSARAREMAVRDRTPAVIAFASFVGFFAILAVLIFKDIPTGANNAIMIMLGALGGIVTSITAYYFGSSAGSAAKSKAMDELLKKG